MPTPATDVTYTAAGSTVQVTAASALNNWTDARQFGAVGDNVSRPLSSVTSLGQYSTAGWSLTQWRTVFPHATALSDELDWCAVQAALNYRRDNNGGPVVIPRRCVMNRGLTITTSHVGITGDGGLAAIRSTGGNYTSISFTGPAGGQIEGNFMRDILFEDAAKSGGLAWRCEQVANLTIDRCSLSDHFGTHFRNFNRVRLSQFASDRLRGAGHHILLTGGESGSTRSSDVFTIEDSSFSGSNSNNAAPTIFNRNGIVIDGFVNTVLVRKGYFIGLEGVPLWLRNSVGSTATPGPGYCTFEGVEIEWPSTTAIRLEAGFLCHINTPQVAGAYATTGIQILEGFRHATLQGGVVMDCGTEGIKTQGQFVNIIGTHVYANSRPTNGRGGVAGQADGIYIGPLARRTSIIGCLLGDDGNANYQRSGIFVDSFTDQFLISGNVGPDNVNGCVLNNTSPSSSRIVANNL